MPKETKTVTQEFIFPRGGKTLWNFFIVLESISGMLLARIFCLQLTQLNFHLCCEVLRKEDKSENWEKNLTDFFAALNFAAVDVFVVVVVCVAGDKNVVAALDHFSFVVIYLNIYC